MKIITLALKDLTRSSRNLFLVGMALGAPLLLTGLMYLAFGGLGSGEATLSPVHVGVVNDDTLPPGAPLEASLGETVRGLFFDQSAVSWIIAEDYAGAAAARAAVDRGEIGVAVLIPGDLTAGFLADGTLAPVTILQDPTLTIGPTVVRDMVEAVLAGVVSGGVAYQTLDAQMQDPAAAAALVEQYTARYADAQRAPSDDPVNAAMVVVSPIVDGQPGENDGASVLAHMMSSVMSGQMIFFAFFTAAYAMMSILQESEEGTLARLFTTPTPRTAILAGTFVAVLASVLLQGLVLLAAGRLLFGVQWGQSGAVALALLGQMLGAVGLGVLLVSFVRTTQQGGMIFGGVLTALGMLSGLFTSNLAMPEAFQALSTLTPQGWVLRGWKLALSGAPASDLLPTVLVLAAMGVVMFAVGATLFRRRFA